ncbi:MAG TPA: hypothetical protein VGM89_19230 [Puia sp.]
MKRADVGPLVIGSIPEFCRLLELPPPEHPLVSVIRFESIRPLPVDLPKTVVLNFFSIWLKKDEQQGSMQFFLPGHGIPRDAEDGLKDCGLWLLIHPELLLHYSVDKNLEQYGFFAAAVAETLRLGGEEERLIREILQNIEQEYLPPVNIFCQEAILSHVETLFIYAERCFRGRPSLPSPRGVRGGGRPGGCSKFPL